MEINKDKLKQFISAIKDKTNITAVELIEKDFYINLLLSKLDVNGYLFKGGTCLAKCYMDYFRFSEDLDFTFADQKLWQGKSMRNIKKICKEKIDEFGKKLESFGLDFKLDKANRKYVEISNNNTLVTFKVYYISVLTGNSFFIKIQINYVEKIIFPGEEKELNALIKEHDFSKEDQIYYRDFLELYNKRKLLVYNLKEIVIEKSRSLLTRRAIKLRDAIDLFFIYQKFKIKPQSLFKETKEKLLFALESHRKYQENFLLSKEKLKTIEFKYSEVSLLVIKPFKKEDFNNFINDLKPFLFGLIDSV